jgi:hypothetical protein
MLSPDDLDNVASWKMYKVSDGRCFIVDLTLNKNAGLCYVDGSRRDRQDFVAQPLPVVSQVARSFHNVENNITNEYHVNNK